MRIAQVAPLQEAVPPRLYGGTERVVSYLTEKLVQLGHDVTLTSEDDLCSVEGGQAGGTALAADSSIVAVIGTSCSGAGVPASSG